MSEKTRGDYMTKGYFLVRDVLAKADGAHLSSDDIYDTLRQSGNAIGRTTVYRQLDRLVNEGYARRTVAERGGNCYSLVKDGCQGHYHLVCAICGKLAHLSCEQVEELFRHIQAEHGFLIDPCQTVLYGTCAACRREAKRKDIPTHA